METPWFLNPWVLSFLGCIIYNILLLSKAKDLFDDQDKGFNFKHYWSKQWDNVLVTLLLSAIWVIVAPIIIQSQPTIDWSDILYIASPIFIQKIKERF